MIDYRTFGLDLAYKAGRIMRENFSLGMKKEWKENNTPLTVSDTKINSMVVNAVKEHYPGYAVLGEEESHIEDSEYVWVCDPIDGTMPFSHGIPVSTFSLALTHKGVPLFGVIYDPYMDRLFVAEKGKGAFLNNEKMEVNDRPSLVNSAMSVEGKSMELLSQVVKKDLLLRGAKVIHIASFAYCGALVSAGEFVGTIFFPTSPWDVAAVKIIVDEAGGKCTDLEGADQRYDKDTNGFIASNGLVHDELVEIIKNCKGRDI